MENRILITFKNKIMQKTLTTATLCASAVFGTSLSATSALEQYTGGSTYDKVLLGYQKDCEYVSDITDSCDKANYLPLCRGYDYSLASKTSCCRERLC